MPLPAHVLSPVIALTTDRDISRSKPYDPFFSTFMQRFRHLQGLDTRFALDTEDLDSIKKYTKSRKQTINAKVICAASDSEISVHFETATAAKPLRS
jgi:hypothetical protein